MTDDEVWARVHKFASERLLDGEPVYTFTKGVRNFITDVATDSIGRRSDEGKTNASRVTRREVQRLWAELNGGAVANVLFFTRALLALALDDVVEVVDGKLRFRSDPLRFEESVEEIEGMPASRGSKRQGFVIDPILRLALETYAMERARQHFEDLGYEVDSSVHKVHPYDLLCCKGSEVLYVEAKATTTVGEAVRVTTNEVEFARNHESQMALFVVHSIAVTKGEDAFVLSGGTEVVYQPWRIGSGELTPVSFFWARPTEDDVIVIDDDAFGFASEFSQGHMVDADGATRVRQLAFRLPPSVRAWLAQRKGRIVVASREGPGFTQRFRAGLPAQSEVVLLREFSSIPEDWAYATLAHELAHIFHRDHDNEATGLLEREIQADLTAASWGFRDGLISHHQALVEREEDDAIKRDLVQRIAALQGIDGSP